MKKLLFISAVIIIALMSSCEKENIDPDDNNDDDNQENFEELSNTENGILGTWYYYSGIGEEYRCITFNNDRTACYFEIKTLSASATKGNQKCYTDWNVDEDVVEGTVFDVNVIGDYTGGIYWAGYTINTQDWILRKKSDNIELAETSKIECDFCD